METRAVYLIVAGLLLLAASIVTLEYNLAQPEIKEALDDGKLTDVQKVAIQHLVELVKLFVNWTIGLLSALVLSFSSVLSLQRHLLVSHLISMGYEISCQAF